MERNVSFNDDLNNQIYYDINGVIITQQQHQQHQQQQEYGYDDDEDYYQDASFLSSSSDSTDNIIIKKEDAIGSTESVIIVDGGKRLPQQQSFKEFMTRDKIQIYIISVLIVIFLLVYGLVAPNLFINYVFNKYPDRSEKENNARATQLKSYGDALPYAVFFLFGPILGAISDKFGRKVVYYITLTALLIDITSCLISLKTNNLIYFYIGHSIGGIGTNGFTPNSLSYLADITDAVDRSRAYGLMGAAVGIGIVVGPAFSIGFAAIPNIYASLYASYILIGAVFVCILFLKETIHLAQKTPGVIKRTLNPFKALWRMLSKSVYLCFVSLLYFAYMFTSQDMISTYFMYTRIRYGWTPKTISSFMAIGGIAWIFWNSVLIPLILKRFSERKLVSFAFLFGGVFHVLYGFSSNQWMWLVVNTIGSFSSILMFLLPSLVSKAAPPEIQGSALAGASSLSSIASFTGSLASQNLLSYFTSDNAPIYLPGAQYFVNSVVLFITFIFSLLIFKYCKGPTKSEIRKAVSEDNLQGLDNDNEPLLINHG